MEQDSFAIIPLQPPYDYGIGRILEVTSSGKLRFQWWGNTTNNNAVTFRPGWVGSKDKIYYAASRKHHSHKAYEGDEVMEIEQKSVVLHSFPLTSGGKLPAGVLRALNKDTRVGGS